MNVSSVTSAVPISLTAKSGLSWNQSLLQKRLLLGIEKRYEGQFFALPALTLQVGDEQLTPSLSLFAGISSLLHPDEAIVTTLPLTVVELLAPYQKLAELTTVAQKYLAIGIQSCWLVIPPIQAIAITVKAGDYQAFDSRKTLRDPATGIELELNALFQ